MKKLVFTLFFAAIAAHAEWLQTPFGPAWIGPGPRPVEQKPVELPKPAPFLPTFEQGIKVKCSLPQCGEAIVNEQYFATKETADWVCKRLACAAVFEQPYGGAGGPFYVAVKERWLAWPDGLTQNAGLLAAYYLRNPPDIADRLLAPILAALHAAKQQGK